RGCPTGGPTAPCRAATTSDTAERSTSPPDDARWSHPAPRTFPHQGWVYANGLTLVAPGLPEAEVTQDGTIALTLLRATGWLARYDLRTRPVPAGPPMRVAGAQVPGPLEVRLALFAGEDPNAARDAELGLRGVIAGPVPLLAPDTPLLALATPALVLSAVKPAEDGDGIVVRVLNPTDSARTAELRPGFRVSAAQAVRLDEELATDAILVDGDRVRFAVPAHALRSVLLRSNGPGTRPFDDRRRAG